MFSNGALRVQAASENCAHFSTGHEAKLWNQKALTHHKTNSNHVVKIK